MSSPSVVLEVCKLWLAGGAKAAFGNTLTKQDQIDGEEIVGLLYESSGVCTAVTASRRIQFRADDVAAWATEVGK